MAAEISNMFDLLAFVEIALGQSSAYAINDVAKSHTLCGHLPSQTAFRQTEFIGNGRRR